MDNVVADAEFGEVQKLVNLRLYGKHSAARLQVGFGAPAEEVAQAHERRTRCTRGQNSPLGAERAAEILNNKALAERRIHKMQVALSALGGEKPAD